MELLTRIIHERDERAGFKVFFGGKAGGEEGREEVGRGSLFYFPAKARPDSGSGLILGAPPPVAVERD